MDFINFLSLFNRKPQAYANIQGGPEHPALRGRVLFYQTAFGVIVSCEMSGLPTTSEVCKAPIFALHIHSGGSCTGTEADPFSDALTHYNPKDCPHPYHAGDLPPLFGSNGVAFSSFLTNRFSVSEVIGKAIIIHSRPDDFGSQPAGNAGEKIACGEIRKNILI